MQPVDQWSISKLCNDGVVSVVDDDDGGGDYDDEESRNP